jgi:hypothetical protein
VIFIASIAVHMQPGDARINNIIHSLLDAQINSTSDLLQRSICHHLAPLMAMIGEDEVPAYVTRLLKTVETSKERHQRRGASWGVAALVKGRKLPALKKYDILNGIERLLKVSSPTNLENNAHKQRCLLLASSVDIFSPVADRYCYTSTDRTFSPSPFISLSPHISALFCLSPRISAG